FKFDHSPPAKAARIARIVVASAERASGSWKADERDGAWSAPGAEAARRANRWRISHEKPTITKASMANTVPQRGTEIMVASRSNRSICWNRHHRVHSVDPTMSAKPALVTIGRRQRTFITRLTAP